MSQESIWTFLASRKAKYMVDIWIWMEGGCEWEVEDSEKWGRVAAISRSLSIISFQNWFGVPCFLWPIISLNINPKDFVEQIQNAFLYFGSILLAAGSLFSNIFPRQQVAVPLGGPSREQRAGTMCKHFAKLRISPESENCPGWPGLGWWGLGCSLLTAI